MINNKIIRFLIVFLCFEFIMTSIITNIFADNYEHIDNCDIEHCPVCALIILSMGIIKHVVLINIGILLLTVLFILIQLIRDTTDIKKPTLVKLKVIQIM